MNPIKLFLKLSMLQKVLFCLASFFMIKSITQIYQHDFFSKNSNDNLQHNVYVLLNDNEIINNDTTFNKTIEKENYSTSKFENVTLNYTYEIPYLSISYKDKSEYVFSKLWFYYFLHELFVISEMLILILIIIIVLAVKQNNLFNKTVIICCKIIAYILITVSITHITKDYIIEGFLHENFFGKLGELGIHSKAKNFFSPLFFAFVIFVLIDVFKKGNKIEQENDLTI